MLGLPKSTELKKQVPKNAIYAKFNMNSLAKEKFDEDIKRITIVNEISPVTIATIKGEKVSSFFVLLVSLKKENFDENSIGLISKIINQNMLFILEYEEKAKLAVYHEKLFKTEWKSIDGLAIELKGHNLDYIWQNIILQIGDIEIKEGNTLEEQSAINEKEKIVRNQIEKLEKQARAEKQPKKKFEIVQQIKLLRR